MFDLKNFPQVSARAYPNRISDDILRSLGWDNLETRRLKQKVVAMYKIMNGAMPAYMQDFFCKVSDAYHYDTCSSHPVLCLPKPKTNFLKRSFKYNGVVECSP